MSKKKRTYNSDMVSPFIVEVHQKTTKDDKHLDQTHSIDPKKQNFPPELIARLTERIKKI